MEVKIRMGKIIKAYEDVIRARNHVVFMNQHGNQKDIEDAVAMRERVGDMLPPPMQSIEAGASCSMQLTLQA